MLHSGEFALDMLYKLVHCRGGKSSLEGTSLFPHHSPVTCQTESCTGVPGCWQGCQGRGLSPGRPGHQPLEGLRPRARSVPGSLGLGWDGARGVKEDKHITPCMPPCRIISPAVICWTWHPRAENIILAIWGQPSWLCPLERPTRSHRCCAGQGTEGPWLSLLGSNKNISELSTLFSCTIQTTSPY